MAVATKSDPSTQVLAGKRMEGSMMRNGVGQAQTRPVEDITSSTEKAMDPKLRQSLEALDQANVVRLHRAETRRKLRTSELDFDELIDETPVSCAPVAVIKILTWMPYIGRSKARKILGRLGTYGRPVTTDTRLGELSARDKYLLSALVGEHMEGYRERRAS